MDACFDLVQGRKDALPAASGRRIDVEASLWITFAGERAGQVEHHLDVLRLLRQIGAVS